MKKYLFISFAALTFASCDLLSPGDIENPNVDEETFIHSSGAMSAWVAGAEKSLATTVDEFACQTEIMSDNYYNNYTMGSQNFDVPEILYTDSYVTDLQRYVANLRATADEGLTRVAEADKSTTDAQRQRLTTIKGYASLLAGEYFVGLPMETGGEIVGWREHLQEAVTTFRKALELHPADTAKAAVYTYMARAYYRLGEKDSAVACARRSLDTDPTFVAKVRFDGVNGMTNWTQFYIYDPKYQPLPRLDFLDPKYFRLNSSTEQRPIVTAKAEENYLIMAEACLADNKVEQAREMLRSLVSLVKSRPVQKGVNDQAESRGEGGYRLYPNSSDYRVAASAADTLRAGLVVDRRAPHLVDVPYISGTSVTEDMINRTATVDGLLELVYLMRQEIFFAEGRRAADLGLRMPVCETEAAHASNSAGYTTAQIPPFIPLEKGMDDFTMDADTRTCVIRYNMNHVIVENKQSDYVCPFFH